MKFDQQVVTLSNILSDEQIASIYYEAIHRPTSRAFFDGYSQVITNFQMPQDIYDIVVDHCQKITGKNNLYIAAYQFARYRNMHTQDGKYVIPILSPHYDDAFASPRITFDYQIGGNTKWGIGVDGYGEKELENNEAIVFGGTHQIHWRPHKVFSESDYLDMIFMHLSEIGDPPVEDGVKEVMAESETRCWGEWMSKINYDLESYYGQADNLENHKYLDNKAPKDYV